MVDEQTPVQETHLNLDVPEEEVTDGSDGSVVSDEKKNEDAAPDTAPTPDAPTAPVVEDSIADEVEEEVAPQPVEEDRSAFNCTACKGLGIHIELNEICTTCKGGGKV